MVEASVVGSCDGVAEARQEAAVAVAGFVQEVEGGGGGGGEESEDGEASRRERRGHGTGIGVEILWKLHENRMRHWQASS